MYITDINVNDGRKLTRTFVNYIKLDIFQGISSLKPHILFYSNSLAIWHSFSDTTHTRVHNGIRSAI